MEATNSPACTKGAGVFEALKLALYVRVSQPFSAVQHG